MLRLQYLFLVCVLTICVSASGVSHAADASNWYDYYNAESHFAFKYPPGWEVVDAFFYKTDYVATIQKIGGSEDSVNWIRVNSPQFMTEDGKCIDVDEQHICTYSKDAEVLGILKMLADSFEIKPAEQGMDKK